MYGSGATRERPAPLAPWVRLLYHRLPSFKHRQDTAFSSGMIAKDVVTAQVLEFPSVQARQQPNRLHQAGYWSLIVLALALPFEATQHPLLRSSLVVVTNLKVVVYVVVTIALVTLAPQALQFIREVAAGVPSTTNYLYRRRVAVGLFAALVLICVLSSLLATQKREGLKWTLDVVFGGLIWLAVPLWVSDDPDRRIERITRAFVVGAVIAAVIGLFEVGIGTDFAQHLLWFKAKPTSAGPYLRLSGTFEYANIAALYFELALAFAVIELVRAVVAGREERVAVALWLVAVGVLFAAVLLTYSRGALLGLVAAIVACAFSVRRSRLIALLRSRGRSFLAVGSALGLLMIIVVLSSPSLTILRVASESDQDWYRAAYSSSLPTTMEAGGQLSLPVTVTNLGPLPWSARGQHPYHLSYHWLRPSGHVVVFDAARASLPSDVPAGQSRRVIVPLRAPATPGRYLLVWDMVQENVAWFSLKTARYQVHPVRIVGHAVKSIQEYGPATLPTAPSQPGRRALWAAAVRMLVSHPLLGVGPDGFRLNYGRYARPKQRSWDTRVFANSLPVEIFADLGIVGGTMFWVFLAAALWTLLSIVRSGEVAAWWQLALVGSVAAFLGHGLVDYILGSDAIFFLFWLLCGLVGAAVGTSREPRELLIKRRG